MTKGNSALTPIAVFIEMMINQRTHFIQPSVRRSKVTAKLVLDQMAAQIEKTPAAEMIGMAGRRSKKLTSHECAPYCQSTTA